MGRWPNGWGELHARVSAVPFEVFVASACMLPPLAATMFGVGVEVPTVLTELNNIWFVYLWGSLSGIASLLIWWGVLRDNVKPVIVGLRLSAFVWAAYMILIMDNVSTLRGIVFVAAATIGTAISALHSTKLDLRMRYLSKLAAGSTSTEE